MKVLHICSYYLDAKIYRDMCRKLIDKCMDVKVFVPDAKGRNADVSVDEFVHVSRCFRRYDRLIFRYKQAKILKSVEEHYILQNFELLHAHTLFSNGNIAYRIYKKYGIPYVVAIRSTDLYFFFRKLFWLRGLGNRILRNANAVVCIAPELKKHLINDCVKVKYKNEIASKCHIIPNGLEQFWYDNRHANQMRIEDKTVNILTVGQIYWKKNMLVCSEACKLLAERGYNVSHTIVGRKRDKQITQKLVNDDFSNLVEPVPKEKLIEYYRRSHILLVPSIIETFGRVYAEALSQGIPVIYTKGQGFDGFFKDGEIGFAVEAHDAAAIADRLEDIVSNYEQFKNNCNASGNLFDWDRLTDQYISIYKSMKKED